MNNPKSVFVAIAGRPNAGKSTLTNYLVGEKIAIVSDKPQTTRTRINGVLTKGETQYVFIDTPGMHKAKNKLSDQMLKSIRESVTDVDVILMMADATKKISPIEHNLIDSFKDRKTDVVLLINKVDLVKDKSELLSLIKEYSELYDFKEIIPISVRQRIGVGKADLRADFRKIAREHGLHGCLCANGHIARRFDDAVGRMKAPEPGAGLLAFVDQFILKILHRNSLALLEEHCIAE